MEIYRGERFLSRFGRAGDLPERDCFPLLESYMSGECPNHACVLYGLRRTGKSVMMFQSMLKRLDSSAYILCQGDDTMDELSEAMDSLWDEGVRNFFLDEVSRLPGFIDEGQFIADAYTGAGRVVMAGTDSLSFRIVENTSFAGRIAKIRTTMIPYREHVRLLGTCDVDDYAACGGILSGDFSRYPLRAIALNIQNSLKYYESGKRFLGLKNLYESGQLTSAIQKVVLIPNHEFTKEVIQDFWKLSDLTSVRRSLQNPEARETARKLRLPPLLDEVMKELRITDVSVTRDELHLINQYLQYLDLIVPAMCLPESDVKSEDDTVRKRVARELSWNWRKGRADGAWIFRQPGLRWAQVDALIGAVERQAVNQKDFRKEHLDILFREIRANAMGNLLENIVIGETAAALNHEVPVFKLQLAIGEIDMVVLGPETIQLYEIKHSTKADSAFGNHVFNPHAANILEERFGMKVDFKGVLYRGESGKKHGFHNVGEYLEGLRFPMPSLVHEDESALDEGMRL